MHKQAKKNISLRFLLNQGKHKWIVRYCDPVLMRFIQIDTNYAGEKEVVTSQNRYTCALNNPYKYEDRDGNKSLEANVDLNTDSKIKKLLEATKSIANNVVSTLEQAKSTTNKFIENVLNYDPIFELFDDFKFK